MRRPRAKREPRGMDPMKAAGWSGRGDPGPGPGPAGEAALVVKLAALMLPRGEGSGWVGRSPLLECACCSERGDSGGVRCRGSEVLRLRIPVPALPGGPPPAAPGLASRPLPPPPPSMLLLPELWPEALPPWLVKELVREGMGMVGRGASWGGRGVCSTGSGARVPEGLRCILPGDGGPPLLWEYLPLPALEEASPKSASGRLYTS